MIRKSQSGIEFLIISGAVMFMFVVFFVAIQSNTSEREKDRENLLVKNLALSVQDEINLATEASDGYSRDFRIPKTILGGDYDISLVENSVYIKTNRVAISLEIGKVIGDIKKEDNRIRKENGEVYLNEP